MIDQVSIEMILAWNSRYPVGDHVLYCGPVSNRLGVALAGICNEVTLLDVVEDRINKANRDLFDEDRIIRQKIEYVFGDFLSYEFNLSYYQTIIISEPETAPDKMIYAKAAVLLVPDGHLLLSGEVMALSDHFSEFFTIQHSAQLGRQKSMIVAVKKSDIAYTALLAELIIQNRKYEIKSAELHTRLEAGTQNEAKQNRDYIALSDAYVQLKAQLAMTDIELDEIKQEDVQLRSTISQLEENEVLLNDNLSQLRDNERVLNESVAQLRTHEKVLSDTITQLKAKEEALIKAVAQLRAHEKVLSGTILQLKVKEEALIKTVAQHEENEFKLKNTIDEQIKHYEQMVSDYQSKLHDHRKKITETERMKKIYESELLRYKALYKNIIQSKRYRIGTALSDIAKNPLMLFVYFRLLISMAGKRRRKKELPLPNLSKKKKFRYKGISVIIPTYREQPYFDACVESVLRQTLDPAKIEIVISVNGKDHDYYTRLKKKYAANRIIRVIYTQTPGLSAGRNFAVCHAGMDYITFLDDDDYFTNGYLESLADNLDDDVTIVCGRLVDETRSGLDENTYINRELSKIAGGGKTTDYFSIGSLFTPAWAKLYKTDLLRNVFTPFDESVMHTEDVRYWTDNFHRLSGSIYCCDSNGHEALVRRVLDNSMSRPSEEKLFQFWINDRIDLIGYIAKGVFSKDQFPVAKRFLLNKINMQTQLMVNYFLTLNQDMKDEALALINGSDCCYLNKGKFSQTQGIAFCHNFPPAADASAYVAAKRLDAINGLENKWIKWDVISSDMSNCRKNDTLFNMFYASYKINNHVVLPGPSFFNEKAQYQFGCDACERMKDLEAQIIYSRSMFAGSHLAAYKYKQLHPQATWYAEFSDPIYMGTDNQKRPTARQYEGDDAFLNDFWKDCETQVYQTADIIIFTNENQRTYMLASNGDKQTKERVMQKSIIMHHPILDKRYCSIITCPYVLDSKKINIGFFGSFYANRKHHDMLTLLDNYDVVLHLFVPEPDALKSLENKRVRVNAAVGHLEYLNIAAKMDYLYLNDIEFSGDPNPYLPSKFSDYLTAGANIIAVVKDNSILSAYEHPALIKVKNTAEITDHLRKKS